MCGICGFNWDERRLIRIMNSEIEHRGPDDRGYLNDRHVSLGHRRLSILDLSKAGKQPMHDKDEEIHITYNGEIYNYLEIKKDLEKKYRFRSNTDTEMIIYAYKEYGERCLEKFNGMFSLCIYDKRKKILFLARDRLGIKPLFYYLKEGKFIFASEIKAILAHKSVKRIINRDALNRFISLRYIPGKETMWSDIYRVLPGRSLIFDLKKKKLSENKWWGLKRDSRLSDKSESFYEKHVFKILKQSVKRRLLSDVPVGAYLSGGIDSSAIVLMMDKIKRETGDREEIKTFSVGFEHGDYVNELPFARQISEKFGTNHQELFIKPDIVKVLPKILWHLDEPIADPATIPVFMLSKEAKKSVTVILTGDGGDEVFGGYDQYRFLSLGNKLRHVPFSDKASKFMDIVPSTLLNKFYKYSSKMGKDSFKKVDRMIMAFKEKNPAKAYYELVSIISDLERKRLLSPDWFKKIDYKRINKDFFEDKEDYLTQLLHFDIANLLPESYLPKTDRMCMAYAIENRVPFLDHKLVEFAHSMPSNMKLRRGKTKYMLRKSLSGHLPKNILYRKKQTFHVPIEKWLKYDLKSYCDEMLEEKKIAKMGIFNRRAISKIFKNYHKGELFYARQAWNLISFKIWHDIYMR